MAADLVDDLTGADSDDDPNNGTVSSQGPDVDFAGTGGQATGQSKRAGGGKGGRKAKRRRSGKAAAEIARSERAAARQANTAARRQGRRARPKVYGDAAYGTGEFLDQLARAAIDRRCKTQPPAASGGHYSKDHFYIDLDTDTVTCPAGEEVPIRRNKTGDGIAYFEAACAACPLRPDCTTAAGGRTITVSRHEAPLAEARVQAQDPQWRDDYRATRPKIERKLAHLMRRRHGGRRARVRGRTKVGADFNLLAAAHNLARLAILGVRSGPDRAWTIT